MNTILRNARVDEGPDAPSVDIAIEDGRIVGIGSGIASEGLEYDLGNCLVTPGFVETHLHLDKSCILDRIPPGDAGLDDAISSVADLKQGFTPEDVYQRARRTVEKCIVKGTTHIRTHLEVDPVIGLRSLEGITPLIDEFRWAVDIEVCVFPQEGLLNNPGTDELLVQGLRHGCRAIGAAPYTDSDPRGQIDRVFELAREFDVDIDMHLDFGHESESMDMDYVCELTDRFGYGGRVAIGHATKLSTLPPERLLEKARRLADSGVAVTVLPSTDLYLMGRHQDHSVLRGVAPVHRMLQEGVNSSLSTNNVLNPFTPFGDCSLVRMANLYANICQVGDRSEIEECFQMVTTRSARLLGLADYGIEIGRSADLVVLDCDSRHAAVTEVVDPVMGFKAGRRTFSHPPAILEAP